MALARQISTYDRNMDGSAAPALPQVERSPRTTARPAAKPARRNLGSTVFLGLGWLTVLVLGLFIVYRNTLVMTETAALTDKREALAKLEQQVRVKETGLNVSIDDVEKWAAAHKMQRAATVKTVAADMTAVAPVPDPEPVVAQAAPEQGGILGALKGYLARLNIAGRSALGSK